MKNIAIVYNDSRNANAIDYIEGVLKDIFSGYIAIKHYFLEELSQEQIIEADAVLLHGEKLIYPVQPHLVKMDNLIVLNRSINTNYLPSLMKIPKNTDVLVVNDTPESTMDVLYTLYGLGMHFNLIPFDESKNAASAYKQIKYAITPGEPQIVPSHIENVLDIGYRKIDFDALLKLMDLLELNNEEVNNKLIRYLNTVTEPNMHSQANYLESYIKNLIINHLVSDSGFSFLAFGTNGRLLFKNDNAVKTFSGAVLPDLSGQDCRNQLINVGGANYLMDRISIDSAGQKLGYIVSLRNETKIRETENFLTKKLKEKGVYARYNFDDIISNTPVMESCISTAKRAALTDHTVLLRGESGTGKELFAQSIHNYSKRKNRPFVAVNCSALPESLLESELFGYVSGAFTGAHKNGKPGLFEQANTGTLFLDEIGDISPALQTGLLRVLQEKQIMRIGSDRVIDVDIRIITATNRNLIQLVEQGEFRRDLFYRLCVIPIDIPPLRSRTEDILPLFKFFAGADYDKLTSAQLSTLRSYHYPGNVRELENMATYFRVMGKFPAATSVSQICPDADGHVITSSAEERSKRLILELLRESTLAGKGTGHPELLNLLSRAGLHCSDAKLRRMLCDLKDQGYIIVKKGRGATTITDLGIGYLNR